MKKLVLFCLISALTFGEISQKELMKVGDKIFKNETGGKREKLIHWNKGEEFPSLGIGHFIWYPEGYEGPFDESFPEYIKFLRKKGVRYPKILASDDAPWDSREEFYSVKGRRDVQSAIDYLEATKGYQVHFIYKRLEKSLDKMLKKTDKKRHVKKQFKRMANTKYGLYPLLDYVNFKGEGTKKTERYNGQGWGLLQVLENMQGDSLGQEALNEFSRSAKYVLNRRVKNSDPKRRESRWIKGWEKRCNTYKNFR